MRAGPIVQPPRASQNDGTGGELLHKISESGLDRVACAAMLTESQLEGVAAEARALSQETSNPLTERNLVEVKQADDGLGDHQNLGSMQLKKTPACLLERRILDVIASYQL